MATDFSLELHHIGLSGNPEAPMRLVDGHQARPPPFAKPGRVEFSLIETHFSYGLQRTHENSNVVHIDRRLQIPTLYQSGAEVSARGFDSTRLQEYG